MYHWEKTHPNIITDIDGKHSMDNFNTKELNRFS